MVSDQNEVEAELDETSAIEELDKNVIENNSACEACDVTCENSVIENTENREVQLKDSEPPAVDNETGRDTGGDETEEENPAGGFIEESILSHILSGDDESGRERQSDAIIDDIPVEDVHNSQLSSETTCCETGNNQLCISSEETDPKNEVPACEELERPESDGLIIADVVTVNEKKEYDDGVGSWCSSRCNVYDCELERPKKRRKRSFGEESLTINNITNLLYQYKCENCDFFSTSVSAIKIHLLLKHSEATHLVCSVCSRQFSSDDSLLEHICSLHQHQFKLEFKCYFDGCIKTFHKVENLRHHFVIEHNLNQLIPCSFCFLETYSIDLLISHIKGHLRNRLKCAYCLTAFESKDKVISHIVSCHPGLAKKINVQIEIVNHERSQKNSKRCEKIKKTISSETIFLENKSAEELVISKATKTLLRQCQECTYTCNDAGSMNSHMKEAHSEKANVVKDFHCTFCKFKTNSKEKLRIHLSCHTNVKFLRCYSCPYCTKQSSSMDIIETHLNDWHPSDSFKFEAVQESVNYLQNMVLCPFCSEAHSWKMDFCNHLTSKHDLKKLADFFLLQCAIDEFVNNLTISTKYLKEKLNITLPAVMVTNNTDSKKSVSDNCPVIEEASSMMYRCIKCNFVDNNYDAYEEHVKKHYIEAKRMKSGGKKGNPMLFVCKLCPFQCAKSLNFKRHSAIHERAKNLENCFKCGYCQFMHGRINCVKFHLGKYHENLPVKVLKVTNGEEINFTKMVENNKFGSENRLFSKCSKSLGKDKSANEYFDSFLPRGMIFASPVKCPNCEYSNRVRVNLIRHMRQHLSENNTSHRGDNSAVSPKEVLGPGKAKSLGPASVRKSMSREDELTFSNPEIANLAFGDGVTTKKLFKCAYCDVVSKWNRRDITLHILHVHLQKKVYSCSYCEYGSRKSSQMVVNHCARVHPGKQVIIKDELALFNSVVPLRDGDGVVPVAFIKKNGTPILSLDELGIYLKLNVQLNKGSSSVNEDEDMEDSKPMDSPHIEADISEKFALDFDEEDFPRNIDNSEEWKCLFCGLQMFSEAMMKRHIMCHHMKLKPYQCKHCSANYWQKQSIENHIRCNHPAEEIVFIETAKEKVSILSKYMQKITNVHRIRQHSQPRGSSVYHCRICGYQDPRHDKTKYHVVKKHLKIGLYSCSECHQHMGGKGYVENHIQELHPNTRAYVCRSYDTHALFLQKTIKKISNNRPNFNKTQSSKNQFNANNKRNSIRIKSETAEKLSQMDNLFSCSHCSYVAETEASLGAHARVHKVFECFYCSYQNNLVSRVQSHCLIKHPTKPIKHRQIAPVSMTSEECSIGVFNEESPSIEDCNDNKLTISPKKDDPDNLPAADSPIDKKNEDGFFLEFAEDRANLYKSGIVFIYKCKLCNYCSDRVTVIRHHIMLHLLYHPYQCPYCDHVRSVKSSPITKHIQMKHPDKEIHFLCRRDEEMEKQVRSSYEKISFDATGNITGVDALTQSPQIVKDEEHFITNQRIYYKCCFCSLVTSIRTDMKHHLMRELKYKPFSCAYCQYEEPCRSKMGKHFRIKHPGMMISIKHLVVREKEIQILECLQKCMIRNNKNIKHSEQDFKDDPDLKTEVLSDNSSNIPIIRISTLQNGLTSSLHYRGKLYKCLHCSFNASDIKCLILHKSFCHNFKLKCVHCGYSNSSILLLRKHIKRCHKKVPIVLPQLRSKEIRGKAEESSGVLLAVGKWACCYCSQSFNSISQLQEHITKFHPCNSSLWISKTLKSKFQEKKDSRPIKFCCIECSHKFLAMSEFISHLESHQNTKIQFPALEVLASETSTSNQQCGFCEFATSCTEEFSSHVTTHTTLNPIVCKYCTFASFTSSDMKHHFGAKHPNQDVGFDTLKRPYTMIPQTDRVNKVINFNPIVKLVDFKFCLS